jgi:hypothetical protein
MFFASNHPLQKRGEIVAYILAAVILAENAVILTCLQ